MVIALTRTSLRQLYKVWYEPQRYHFDSRWSMCSTYSFCHWKVDLHRASSRTWFISCDRTITISIGVDFIFLKHISGLINRIGLSGLAKSTAIQACMDRSSIIWTHIGAPSSWSCCKIHSLSMVGSSDQVIDDTIDGSGVVGHHCTNHQEGWTGGLFIQWVYSYPFQNAKEKISLAF